MRKKQRRGGLSPHHVRLIRKYLCTLYDPNASQATTTAALFAWTDLFMGGDLMAASRLQTIGLAGGTVKALRAGLEVMKRKRVGRIWALEPRRSRPARSSGA
jgi:hypothetical protein